MAAPQIPEGWVFSASIPSWTQTTLEGDELVVVSTPWPVFKLEANFLSGVALRSNSTSAENALAY